MLGYSTLGHDGTQNLGHKIWDTKFGTRNLGQKIWDRKFGTENLGRKMGDKGTQHLTLGLDGTRWDTARWDTTGHNGENGTQRDTMGHNTLGLRYDWRGHVGLQHVGTRWDTTGHKIWDTKSGTQNLGHKIWDTKFGIEIGNTKFGTQNGRQGDTTPHLRIGRDTLGYTLGHNGKMGHNGTQHLRFTLGFTLGWDTLGHVGTRQDTKSGTQNLGREIWDTKFGTENLGRKIWDTNWETRGHNGTQRDTMGHNTLGLR